MTFRQRKAFEVNDKGELFIDGERATPEQERQFGISYPGWIPHCKKHKTGISMSIDADGNVSLDGEAGSIKIRKSGAVNIDGASSIKYERTETFKPEDKLGFELGFSDRATVLARHGGTVLIAIIAFTAIRGGGNSDFAIGVMFLIAVIAMALVHPKGGNNGNA